MITVHAEIRWTLGHNLTLLWLKGIRFFHQSHNTVLFGGLFTLKQWIISSLKHDTVPRVNKLYCFYVKNPPKRIALWDRENSQCNFQEPKFRYSCLVSSSRVIQRAVTCLALSKKGRQYKFSILKAHGLVTVTFLPNNSVDGESIAGACFSKVPKLYGPISGAIISLISSQHRGSKPSNFAILLVFPTLKSR